MHKAMDINQANKKSKVYIPPAKRKPTLAKTSTAFDINKNPPIYIPSQTDNSTPLNPSKKPPVYIPPQKRTSSNLVKKKRFIFVGPNKEKNFAGPIFCACAPEARFLPLPLCLLRSDRCGLRYVSRDDQTYHGMNLPRSCSSNSFHSSVGWCDRSTCLESHLANYLETTLVPLLDYCDWWDKLNWINNRGEEIPSWNKVLLPPVPVAQGYTKVVNYWEIECLDSRLENIALEMSNNLLSCELNRLRNRNAALELQIALSDLRMAVIRSTVINSQMERLEVIFSQLKEKVHQLRVPFPCPYTGVSRLTYVNKWKWAICDFKQCSEQIEKEIGGFATDVWKLGDTVECRKTSDVLVISGSIKELATEVIELELQIAGLCGRVLELQAGLNPLEKLLEMEAYSSK